VARAAGRRGIHDAPTRQVGWEVPARLGPREALYRDAGRLGLLGRILAGRRGEFLRLQFQLIEQALAALRARAKQLALGSIRTGAGLKYGQYPGAALEPMGLPRDHCIPQCSEDLLVIIAQSGNFP